MALKIFVSYATDDLEQINPLIDLIKKQGALDVFIAGRSIKPGENFHDRIISEIKKADIFLLFYSKNAGKSQYVQNEIGAARIQNKTIVPILLDREKPMGMITDLNYVDLSNPNRYQMERERLERLLGDNIRKDEFRNLFLISGILLLFLAFLNNKQ